MQSPLPLSASLRAPTAARASLLALSVLAGSLLAGCTGALNTSDDLLGSELPDLAATPTTTPSAEAAAPSLSGSLDRSHWSKTTVRIERRQVEVQPHYATLLRYGRGSAGTPARTSGVWPTPTTSLETTSNGGALALEGVAAPFHAAFDLVAMPVRLFLEPPGSTVRAPSAPACLSPSVSGIESHPAAITPAPAAAPAGAAAGS